MTKRPRQITDEFLTILDTNLKELIEGKTDTYLDINRMAALLYIHPIHLSNTIKETTGKSPCTLCNEKTIDKAKQLLAETHLTIAEIAFKLTYEPTNFTKYFKKWTGITPSAYRASLMETESKVLKPSP